jgi:hypothetical protein
VIGVYEPMIVVVRGSAQETSRAAEPRALARGGPSYHAACYTRMQPRGEQRLTSPA